MRRDRILVLIATLAVAIVAWCILQWRQEDVPASKIHLPIVAYNYPPTYRLYLPYVVKAPVETPEPPRKRGVARSGPCPAVAALRGGWYYDWGWKRRCANVPASHFVPMIFCAKHLLHLEEALEYAKASGFLLGYNEPDLGPPYGCRTTPEQGARAWFVIQREAAARGIKLVSPAPSQEDSDWLWRMVRAYKDLYGEKPRFDAIAVHFYTGYPPSPQKVVDYLLWRRRDALAHGYDVEIWLTEWAGACWLPDPDNGNRRLMEEVIPVLEAQPWIARHSWFASCIWPEEEWCKGCHHCSLADCQTGELTPLGIIYSRRFD